jgi:hypothetical protein
MRYLALLAVACVDVAGDYHCATNADCALDGRDGRCEASTNRCSFADPSCGTGASRYHVHAGEVANQCVIHLAGPIQLPPIDLAAQGDRVEGTCAPFGARDVQLEIDQDDPAPQLVLIDTPQATVGTVISLHDGPCPAGNTEACVGPPCSPAAYGQLLAPVSPGPHCVVVEEAQPGASPSAAEIRIVPAGQSNGLGSGSNAVDTCSQPIDPGGASCNNHAMAHEEIFAFATCPSMFTFHASETGDFDPALVLREGAPNGAEATCGSGTGSATLDAQLMGPGPFWLVVEGATASDCGSGTLTVTAN